MSYFKSMEPFARARAVLVFWNVVLIVIVISFFSTIRYQEELYNIRSAALRHEFGKTIPKKIPLEDEIRIDDLVSDLQNQYVVDQLIIDALIIGSVAALTYFFATKTLNPISQAMQREKEFVANASHELRTPITAIRTACEINLRSGDKTSDDYKKVLAQTYEESSRLGKIVDDMLLLSRSDAGIEKLNMKHIELNKLVTDICDELTFLAVKKNVTLQKNDAEVGVIGDANRLKQLFIILIDNALKYTKPGGTVTVTLAKYPRPSVAVADTGVGMTAEDKLHIFERFYRGDKSRSKTEGNGLGLSIASWIVRVHNARIQVDSTLNKGSVFTVLFNPEEGSETLFDRIRNKTKA